MVTTDTTPPEGPREGLRVAVLRELEGHTPDPAVTTGLDNAANALRAAGYRVEQAAPPHFRERAVVPLVITEAPVRLAQQIEQFGDQKVKTAMGPGSA